MKIGDLYTVNNSLLVKAYPFGLEVETYVKREFEYNKEGYPVNFFETIKEVDESIIKCIHLSI